MPLFANTNMEQQNDKLIQTLVLAIYNERNLAYLATILRDLGARHVRYGVTLEQYPMIGEALLKTFEEYLGTDWTPEVKQVWTDAYAEIAKLMQEGIPHEEASKLENELKPSTNSTTIGFTSIQPAVTTSSLNNDEDNNNEDVYDVENVSQPSTNPNTMDFVPTPTSATTSKLNLKLLMIILTITGLLGVGLVYGFKLVKERQEIITPKE
jgi:hemoglobin-like flavoprotein